MASFAASTLPPFTLALVAASWTLGAVNEQN